MRDAFEGKDLKIQCFYSTLHSFKQPEAPVNQTFITLWLYPFSSVAIIGANS